jgi:alkylation response protein AidB-like acyl-CoA dehydrogenase
MRAFRFEALELPSAAKELRAEVRAFLEAERREGRFQSHRTSWSTFDAEFSRRAGAAGFIGLVLPKEYGGHGRSNLERFVVTEEMLAAGAPSGAHWIADRQSGPQIVRLGSERAKREILPGIAKGEIYFGIGMSEPNSGSDLAAVRTRAEKVEGGWVINGQKIWTSNAHLVQYIIALVRTSPQGESRHAGLSQLIVDMKTPGLEVRPIRNMAGAHEFNEVFFKDVFVPDDMLMGEEGSGWQGVTGELAHERSGPDRFMSDIRVLVELIDHVGGEPDERQAVEIGRLVAHFATLRRMSTAVAGLLERGESPITEAALVKDVGTAFERDLPEVARRIAPVEASPEDQGNLYSEAMANITLNAPSFTLRGGTPEILRGMIARGLGLR